MKRLLLIIAVLGFFASSSYQANAQATITLGTGGYSWYMPFNYYWYSTISESLYPGSEMTGAGWSGPGKIQTVWWDVTVAENYTNGTIEIYMANVPYTSVVSGPWTPDANMTLVWSGPAPLFTTTGWAEFVLDQPFNFDGSNLLIKVKKAGNAYQYPYTTFDMMYTYPTYLFRYDYGDVPITTLEGYDYGSVYSYRPDLRIKFCNEAPSAVDLSVPEFANLPGTIPVNYFLQRPIGEFSADVNVRLTDLNSNTVVALPTFALDIYDASPRTGVVYIDPGNIQPGWYLVEITYTTLDECAEFVDMKVVESILILNAGDTPCIVYPGDVTNDLLVNYADKRAFHSYVHEANLRDSWLRGPARYRSDFAGNPLAYIEWTPQAASPWQTPEGCYMDTDGNGIINNFDNIAIRVNWMRDASGPAKDVKTELSATTFGVSQNYPNPFNPSTSLEYSVPEESSVEIHVYNGAGELVSTLVDQDAVAAGVYNATFDAAGLPSGTYIAVVRMSGNLSDLGFTETVKMSLTK
ncbi:MAG: hypothetical protein CL946_00820 [Ectothiorhodospiraceae bacterium]|nr:hypothetical protein [Ectothiorhodospiraceae bacterium]